jgi:hypothetical protein
MNQRKGDRRNTGEYRYQSLVGNTNKNECTARKNLQSINSDKHLPQSPSTGQFILMTTFCIAIYESYFSTDVPFPPPPAKDSRSRKTPPNYQYMALYVCVSADESWREGGY